MKKMIFLFISTLFVSCLREKPSNKLENSTPTHILTSKLITPEQLDGKSSEELRLIRNEIFARKGYVFKDSLLSTYFSKKEWYKPNKDAEIILSDSEKQNVILLKNLEAK